MKAKLSRKDLLEEIHEEYEAFEALIARVPKDALRTMTVNSADWTLKDVLAHIADWAERCAGWCDAGLRGEEAKPPAPGYKWNETRRLNSDVFQKRKGHSLSRVLRDFHAGHEALVHLANSMEEDSLREPRRFVWCGPTWSVGKHIRANTASHYRWGSKHCKRVLKACETRGRKLPKAQEEGDRRRRP